MATSIITIGTIHTKAVRFFDAHASLSRCESLERTVRLAIQDAMPAAAMIDEGLRHRFDGRKQHAVCNEFATDHSQFLHLAFLLGGSEEPILEIQGEDVIYDELAVENVVGSALRQIALYLAADCAGWLIGRDVYVEVATVIRNETEATITVNLTNP